jgi:hypothetical protein
MKKKIGGSWLGVVGLGGANGGSWSREKKLGVVGEGEKNGG